MDCLPAFSNHGSPWRLVDLVSSSDMIGYDDWPSPELHLKCHIHTKSRDIWTMPLGPQTLEQCIIPKVIPLDILASLWEVDASLLRCITFQLGTGMAAQNAQEWMGCPSDTQAYKCPEALVHEPCVCHYIKVNKSSCPWKSIYICHYLSKKSWGNLCLVCMPDMRMLRYVDG